MVVNADRVVIDGVDTEESAQPIRMLYRGQWYHMPGGSLLSVTAVRRTEVPDSEAGPVQSSLSVCTSSSSLFYFPDSI